MPTLPDALTVLSAMITPAVLLSACASLIIATTSRLTRAVDRTREVSRRFAEIDPENETASIAGERRMLYVQLDYSTTRSRLLQRALAGLYLSVGAFVATSVAIGIVGLSQTGYYGVPMAIGITGSALLLYASLLLVRESRVALVALQVEMDYVWAEGKERWLRSAPPPPTPAKRLFIRQRGRALRRLRWKGPI